MGALVNSKMCNAVNRKTYVVLTTLYLLAINVLYAQDTKLTGSVKDKISNKPVSNVSILLKNKEGKTLNFAISNNQGEFSLILSGPSKNDSLLLELICLGYKKTVQLLDKGTKVYNFLLEEAFIDLDKVEVKTTAPIKINGDTLSYNVDYFARNEDRSIGDVLKRIPGMDVTENGQIKFNGKDIINLYIQGDDLMDGRYGLASKAINKDMIKSIDVLRNFQPIKVLKDKVLTNDVAVNLILKDENSVKLAGQAMLGAGLPSQYDAELNAMIFNKKFKTLNSLKTNNSGIDYRNDFKQYQADNFLSSLDNKRPDLLLSSALASNPDIPRQNYYLNESGVINLNTLYNTKDTIQIRTNVQLFADRNTFNFENNTNNFTLTDTIQFNQMQRLIQKPFVFNTSINIEANKTKSYISNKSSFNFTSDNDFSSVLFNKDGFNQQLLNRTKEFSNNFNWIPRLKGKNILNVGINSSYNNMPQTLDVFSGLEPAILNGGVAYNAVQQFAETPTFFNHISAAYLIPGIIRQEYQIGIVNEWQELKSLLNLTQIDSSITKYTGDVGNNLNWRRNKAFFTPKYSFKNNKWQIISSLPLIWQTIHYIQSEYQLDNSSRRFFFNPKASIRYDLNAEDYLETDYQFSNSLGNISGIYRGLILNNYQTLNRNNAELQEKKISSTGIKYNFQRARILLFMKAGVNYSKVTANTILSSTITNNIQSTVLLPFENDQSKISFDASIKKYIFKIKGNLSFSSVFQRSFFNQFINGQKLSFNNDAIVFEGGIDGKIGEVFTLNYSANLNLSSSEQNNNLNNTPSIANKFSRLNQYFNWGYSPSSKLFFNFRGTHIHVSQQNQPKINYLFMDASLRYKITKLKMDFSIEATNLLNIQEYKIFNVTSNQFSVNSFELRNRMIIARATFNF